MNADGVNRGGVDVEAKHGGEPYRPQHPQMVFCKPGFRLSDSPDYPFFQIRHSAGVVDDLPLKRIAKEGVYGEVPPPGVLFRRHKTNLTRMSSVGIIGIGAESGHIKTHAVLTDHDDAKGFADRHGFAAKDPFHLVRGRGGREEGKTVAITGKLDLSSAPAFALTGDTSLLRSDTRYVIATTTDGITGEFGEVTGLPGNPWSITVTDSNVILSYKNGTLIIFE